jgi:hypothetical protein
VVGGFVWKPREMLDNASKLSLWSGTRKSLVDDEVQRLEQFIQLVIDTTTYGEKAVAYKPRIAYVSTPGLLEEFVDQCRSSRHIDISLVNGECIIRIHAPCPRRRYTE